MTKYECIYVCKYTKEWVFQKTSPYLATCKAAPIIVLEV